MKFFQKFDGGEDFSVREYPIATSTNIKKGTVVQLTGGLVAQAIAGQTGAILGIAMENHSGSADALDPRANGDRILVLDSSDAIFKVPCFEITATGGSATTVTATTLGAYSADEWNGGYLKLVEKAAGSTNTDAIGTVKPITDYTYTSTGTISTFTVASAGTAYNGDKYELYAPVGLAKFNLNATFDALVNTAVNSTVFKVVGCNTDLGEQYIKAVSHF